MSGVVVVGGGGVREVDDPFRQGVGGAPRKFSNSRCL